MQKIIYIRDKCKQEISGEGLVIGLFHPDKGHIAAYAVEGEVYEDEHLCRKCAGLFCEWMHAGDKPDPVENEAENAADGAPEAPATPPVKKVPANMKRLDEGKIKALREAGWSMARIAEEMGCSEATINNRIKRMRNDGVITEEDA